MGTSRLHRIALLVVPAVFLATTRSFAQGEDELDFGVEVLSPAEQEERELQRLRERPPVLSCAPRRLRATLDAGKTRTLSFTVSNAGGQTLNWIVRDAPKWAVVSERSGTLGFREKRTVSVRISSGGLEPGETRGEITIEARGAEGSPRKIPISVRLAEPEEREPKPRRRRRRPERKPRRPDTPRPSVGRNRRFGVRAGYTDFGSGEGVSVNGTPLIGAHYGNGRTKKIWYEVGLDLARTQSSNGSFTDTLLVGRLDFLFPLGNGRPRTRAFLLSGVSGLVDIVDDVNTSSVNSSSALNLGAGLGFWEGRFDVRATYSLLLGNDSSGGIVAVSAGMCF